MTDAVHERIAVLRTRNEQIRTEVAGVREYLDSLQALHEALDQGRDNQRVLGALANSLEHALAPTGASSALLLVLDEDSEELVSVLVHGLDDAAQRTWRRLPASTGFAGWVMRHARAIIANDARSDERHCERMEHELGVAVQSLLAVPVIGRDRVLGLFMFLNKRDQGMFGDDDQTLIAIMSRLPGNCSTACHADPSLNTP